jgi:ParB family chromosome partitioning protein
MARPGEPKLEDLFVDFITVGQRKRVLNADAVSRLAESIEKLGLRTPISVRYYDDRPDAAQGTVDTLLLLAGAHRLAAMKQLGREKIPCLVYYDGDEVDAELWEIAENLHRADLTALERDEQVARWLELSREKVLPQLVPKPDGGRPEGGVRAASRELGVNREDARRATKVASLSDDAKAAAREVGLDDNRTALLTAARAPVEQQAAVVRQYAEKKQTKPPRDNDGTGTPSEAEEFAAALRQKFGPQELPAVITWLTSVKPRDVVRVLRAG